MEDNELKNIWKNAPEKEHIQFDQHKILNDMNLELKKIDNSLKWRNIREIGVGIFLIVLFGMRFFSAQSGLEKLGILLIILATLFIIYKLVTVRNSKQSIDHSISIKDQLLQTRNYLKREQNLGKNILYWYILPIVIPLIIMSLGCYGLSPFGVIYLLSIGALSYFMYYLNQRGVKKLDPYITQIEEKIQQLEADS